jgi:uncharacterized protein (TIGR00369 family)
VVTFGANLTRQRTPQIFPRFQALEDEAEKQNCEKVDATFEPEMLVKRRLQGAGWVCKPIRERNTNMATALAVTDEEVAQILSTSPFAKVYGFKLQSLASGECTLVIPFQQELERPGGIVAGAVFMAAADVAMWLAIMTHLGKEELTVSVELNTSFLSSVKEKDARCTAKVLKLGKTLIYGVAECRSMTDSLLTYHTIRYIRK